MVRTLADELLEVRRRNVGCGFWVYVATRPTLRQICFYLNELGYRTRQGKRFGPETVRLLLRRTTPNPEPVIGFLANWNLEVLGRIMEEGLFVEGDLMNGGFVCRR